MTGGSPDGAISHRVFWRTYCLLAALHVLLCGWEAYRNSPTRNEPAHLAAGVSHLHFQRFDLYRVNPPLVRSVAALPVVLASPKTDWTAYSFDPTERRESQVGGRFAELNGHRFPFLVTLARWACIPFSLLGGWVCGRWATRLHGPPAGILAMSLWFFSPMVVGHASLLTPDAHAAALGVCAMYGIWNWLNQPDWENAAVTGLALGLAELTKFTLLALYPTIILLWAVYWLRPPVQSGKSKARLSNERPAFRQLLFLIVLSVLTINLGYGFEGTCRPLGDYQFQSRLLTGREESQSSSSPNGQKNRFADAILGSLPIPMPANYVQGIDTQRCDFEYGLSSYLRGEWADHGWCYYYLYALALKEPLGTWCLAAMALAFTFFERGRSSSCRDELAVLASGLTLLIFVSSQTGFSVHSRYAIPALPFLFVWISKVARMFRMPPFPRRGLAIAAALVAAIWSIGSSLWSYPHSLSYFNELVGGPRRGAEHLLDSNIDWGQDLLYLKRWLDEHPDVNLDGLTYFGSYRPSLAGIKDTAHPLPGPDSVHDAPSVSAGDFGPVPGWYALTVNDLHGRDRQYCYFLRFKPVAMSGYAFCIYHITLEDANCVRRELGLAELPN